MKKAIYDDENLKKVSAKCTDLYPKINQCIMIARSLDIPSDFEYATRIRELPSKLEKEADKQEKIFRDAHQPEEAHRIATQVSELKEQLLEFQSKINLEGYIRYFYENTVTMPELLSDMAGRSLVFYIDEPARVKEQADAIELEFRESMEQRARKGYVLPGQMNILYNDILNRM